MYSFAALVEMILNKMGTRIRLKEKDKMICVYIYIFFLDDTVAAVESFVSMGTQLELRLLFQFSLI